MTNITKKKTKRWIHSIEITEAGALISFSLLFMALFNVIEMNLFKAFIPLIASYLIQFIAAYAVILRKEKRGGKRR